MWTNKMPIWVLLWLPRLTVGHLHALVSGRVRQTNEYGERRILLHSASRFPLSVRLQRSVPSRAMLYRDTRVLRRVHAIGVRKN